ncbi:hypothetical protein OROMI_006302 [Orobanche minor]
MEATVYTRRLSKFVGTDFYQWRDEMLLFFITFDMAGLLTKYPLAAQLEDYHTSKELWDALEVILDVGGKDAPLWKEAIHKEMNFLMKEMERIIGKFQGELFENFPDTTPLGYKWCLSKKRIEDGTVFKYKATLQGNHFKPKESLI